MSVEAIHRQMNPNLIKNFSKGLLRLFSKDITLTGEEFIPEVGPAIIAANHMGVLEVLPPYAYLLQTPVIFTKSENLEIPVVGNLLKNFGSIAVNRDEVDRQALRSAITMLVYQKIILFTCPEGTRGRDKDSDRTVLKQAKGGIIYIAQKAANKLKGPVPISPWAIWGTEGIFPEIDEPGPIRQRLAFHRDNVFVSVGPPFYIQPSDQRLTRENMQIQIDLVMEQIRNMLPPKYHGFYAEK